MTALSHLEVDLAEGLRKGSSLALERLHREQGNRMKSIAANMLGSRSEAKDAAHDCQKGSGQCSSCTAWRGCAMRRSPRCERGTVLGGQSSAGSRAKWRQPIKTATCATSTAGNASINISWVAGESVVQGSFGGITITNPQGAVTVANQNGAVRVTGARSSVNAKTTFGAIEISGAGGLPAECVPVTARTSFGAVRVALPAGAGYDVLATTSFGRIKSDFEVAVKPGSHSENRLEGRIGAGGCALNITNSNGPVEITRAP